MAAYVVSIKDLDGGTVVANLDYDELEYGFTLDGTPWATIVIDMWKPQATVNNLKEGERVVNITRDASLIWAGYLWDAEGGTETGTIRCTCEGWSSMLYHRLIDVDKTYNDFEQFDLAWDLIDFTQAKTGGNIGITRGAQADTGVLRTIKYRYWERRVIGEVIDELAAMNGGFDYEITPTKVFNMYYPRKGSLLANTFELDVNVHNIYQLRNAREVASEVHGIGGGDEKATCIAVVSDATALATYKLRQSAHDFGDIKHYNTMVRKTERYLSLHKRSTIQPQLGLIVSPPAVGTFGVGDRAPVVANAGYFAINATYRIIAYEVHLDNTGVEVVTVHFDERLTP